MYRQQNPYSNQNQNSYQAQNNFVDQAQGSYANQAQSSYGNQAQGSNGYQGQGTHGNQAPNNYGNQTQVSYDNQAQNSYGSQTKGSFDNQGHGSFGNQGQGNYGNQGQGSYSNQGQSSYDNMAQNTGSYNSGSRPSNNGNIYQGGDRIQNQDQGYQSTQGQHGQYQNTQQNRPVSGNSYPRDGQGSYQHQNQNDPRLGPSAGPNNRSNKAFYQDETDVELERLRALKGSGGVRVKTKQSPKTQTRNISEHNQYAAEASPRQSLGQHNKSMDMYALYQRHKFEPFEYVMDLISLYNAYEKDYNSLTAGKFFEKYTHAYVDDLKRRYKRNERTRDTFMKYKHLKDDQNTMTARDFDRKYPKLKQEEIVTQYKAIRDHTELEDRYHRYSTDKESLTAKEFNERYESRYIDDLEKRYQAYLYDQDLRPVDELDHVERETFSTALPNPAEQPSNREKGLPGTYLLDDPVGNGRRKSEHVMPSRERERSRSSHDANIPSLSRDRERSQSSRDRERSLSSRDRERSQSSRDRERSQPSRDRERSYSARERDGPSRQNDNIVSPRVGGAIMRDRTGDAWPPRKRVIDPILDYDEPSAKRSTQSQNADFLGECKTLEQSIRPPKSQANIQMGLNEAQMSKLRQIEKSVKQHKETENPNVPSSVKRIIDDTMKSLVSQPLQGEDLSHVMGTAMLKIAKELQASGGKGSDQQSTIDPVPTNIIRVSKQDPKWKVPLLFQFFDKFVALDHSDPLFYVKLRKQSNVVYMKLKSAKEVDELLRKHHANPIQYKGVKLNISKASKDDFMVRPNPSVSSGPAKAESSQASKQGGVVSPNVFPLYMKAKGTMSSPCSIRNFFVNQIGTCIVEKKWCNRSVRYAKVNFERREDRNAVFTKFGKVVHIQHQEYEVSVENFDKSATTENQSTQSQNSRKSETTVTTGSRSGHTPRSGPIVPLMSGSVSAPRTEDKTNFKLGPNTPKLGGGPNAESKMAGGGKYDLYVMGPLNVSTSELRKIFEKFGSMTIARRWGRQQDKFAHVLFETQEGRDLVFKQHPGKMFIKNQTHKISKRMLDPHEPDYQPKHKHIQEVGAGTSPRASAAIAGPSASNQYRGLTTSVNDIINKLRSHPQFSPLVSGMSPESLGIAAGVLHNLGADSLERLAQGDTEILGHIQLSMAELEKKQRATAMSVDGRQLPMPVQQAVSPVIAQASFNQDDILAQLNRNPQLRNMFANVDPGAFEVAMKMLSQMDPVMLGRLASGDTSILTQMCAKAGIDLV